MTTDSTEEVNREKLLFDIMDYLKRNYDISEKQITTGRATVDSVSLTVHDAPEDFPGFGHSSVPVFEMSDEIKYGYIPRGNKISIWTVEKGAPEWE